MTREELIERAVEFDEALMEKYLMEEELTDEEIEEALKKAGETFEYADINPTNAETQFYKECKSMGIDSLDKASNFERAKLIAANYGIHPESVRDAFMNALEKESTEKFAEKKAAKYKQEVAEQQKLKITPKCGRERILEELQSQQNKLKRECKEIEEATSSLFSLGAAAMASIPTSSGPHWATLGGIANGIAGPAAGVAVALEAQAQQQREAVRAEAAKQDIADATVKAWDSGVQKQVELENEIEKIEDKIKKAKMLLVDPRSGIDILELMDITNIKATSKKITLNINLPKELLIFDDVKAVVDGSFLVHVYQDKEYVGSTRISVSEERLNGGSRYLSVDTSLGLNSDKNISVELEPEALCLMEQYSF